MTVPHAVDQLVAWKLNVCWRTVPEKKGDISEVIASINQSTLRRVAQNTMKRVNAWILENDGHFQHLYELYIRFVTLLRSEHSVAFKMNTLYFL
jgi:hypothetical protein